MSSFSNVSGWLCKILELKCYQESLHDDAINHGLGQQLPWPTTVHYILIIQAPPFAARLADWLREL